MERVKIYFDNLRKTANDKISFLEDLIIQEILPTNEKLISQQFQYTMQKKVKGGVQRRSMLTSNDECLDTIEINNIEELYSILDLDLESLEQELTITLERREGPLKKENAKNTDS